MISKSTFSKMTVIAMLGTTALALTACSALSSYSELGGGSSTSGVEAYRHGDYKTANTIFAKEYAEHPNDLYALDNLADSYSAIGDWNNAVLYFQKLAATGKNDHPQYYSEKLSGNPTFTDIACYHLKGLQAKDANCV
ncbi:MAG: tetratricopeptide repeat protein [Rhizomicrobium sp.]|nr:tetratricopeptide repeat protein [Rhizomicrobium sp.]